MRRRVVVGTIAIGLIAALAGASLATSASSEVGASGKSKKFKPKKYAGKWKGQWKNTTFDTKGKATMKLKAKGKGKKQKFIGVFDLGGNAFGCADPDPRKRVMKKGKGPNTWNKKGFTVRYDNGQGPVKLKYRVKRQKLSGSGTSPCQPDITYQFDGKMTTKKVNANVDITLPFPPGKAESTLSLKKR